MIRPYEDGGDPVGKTARMRVDGGQVTGVIVSVRDDGAVVEFKIDAPAIEKVETRYLEWA